ncbi:ATP-grasp domain-containing protein [Neolewinella aurantiaca]|uniref:ATP-grasp domain-containing protein n=2 Tax=Neolewinella aurantiaca TaxID=2602767 RepID=A0A5C7FBU7_9BACT|nr:ATP-grasp domain-containing protein [Neolewinella aurantiaca]
MKPGGYSDSGADVAYCLFSNEQEVVVPAASPDPANDYDWVFPDSEAGITAALSAGANVFWLNTVLYTGHPIETFFSEAIEIIGQHPDMVDLFDDKVFTNKRLAENKIDIPESYLIEESNDLALLKDKLQYPVVIKPIRGRGSQGVALVRNKEELSVRSEELLTSQNFGNAFYLERYLPGKEITITVMPPGKYRIREEEVVFEKHWSLPPVERFNHEDGIAPYNGTVAVVNNSKVLTGDELKDEAVGRAMSQCEEAAALVEARAPIRIDCRASAAGKYYLFDLNMKPNLTGASRKHRADQDSLTTIAARGIGWSYFDLLRNIAAQKWTPVAKS